MNQGSQNSNRKLKKRASEVNMFSSTSNYIQKFEEITDSTPRSYVVKDALEYFKPKIHVEMDNPDKQETVTEIHVKGWKLDKTLIEVFGLCLPALDLLNTLK
jgi:hypothetical protein